MKKVFLDDMPRKGSRIDWINSVGKNVKFIYEDVTGTIDIIAYNKENLTVVFNNNKSIINANNLSMGGIGAVIGHINNKYLYNINDTVTVKSGELKIINQVRKRSGKCNLRSYVYECSTCKYIGEIREVHLSAGVGCPVCSNKKIKLGVNDMWTTNPKLATQLANKEDGYKYTQNSVKIVDWKCGNCGVIVKNKKISIAKKKNIVVCNQCSDEMSDTILNDISDSVSDGVSYPEKFVSNMLSQLKINFTTQKKFSWSDNKRYDFYIENLDMIIEVNGMQHYKEGNRGRSLKEECENDTYKQKLANDHNIKNYIIIDARYSNCGFIKKSIINSELSKKYNLSKIDWNACHKSACISFVKTACDIWNSGIHSTSVIANKINVNAATVLRYLKAGTEAGLCNYTVKSSLKGRTNAIKKIVCLNNGEVFKYIGEACSLYGISNGSMSLACTGKLRAAGKHPITKEPLVWMYYNDYLNATKEEINAKLNASKNYKNRKNIVCINTSEIFKTVRDAKDKYKSYQILDCCDGKCKSAGKHPITGEKLRWMYYDDYIKQIN